MTFKQALLDVQQYVRLSGGKSEFYIKRFLNDAVIDFCRLEEWRMTRVSETLTLDGSSSYPTSDFDNYFLGELSLFDSAGTEQQKLGYERYLAETTKTGLWSMFGSDVYIEGESGDYSFLFITPGEREEFPMEDDADEPLVMQNYSDIICQYAAVKFLRQLQDPNVQAEMAVLNEKIQLLKQHEHRIDKNGMLKVVSRY